MEKIKKKFGRDTLQNTSSVVLHADVFMAQRIVFLIRDYCDFFFKK